MKLSSWAWILIATHLVFADDHNLSKKSAEHLDANKSNIVHQISNKYHQIIQNHQQKMQDLESELKQILSKDPDNNAAIEANCRARGQEWAEIQIQKFRRDQEIRKALGKSDWIIYLRSRKTK